MDNKSILSVTDEAKFIVAKSDRVKDKASQYMQLSKQRDMILSGSYRTSSLILKDANAGIEASFYLGSPIPDAVISIALAIVEGDMRHIKSEIIELQKSINDKLGLISGQPDP